MLTIDLNPNDGNYYISIENRRIMILPAIADEIRMALTPGYQPAGDDPRRVDLRQMAIQAEPPHPDD